MQNIEQFKYFLLREGMSKRTIEKNVFIIDRIIRNVETLTSESAEKHIYNLLEQGRSKGYLNTIVSSLRFYGRFIEDEKYKDIKFFKVLETEKATMTIDEINSLIMITHEDMTRFLKEKSIKRGNHTRKGIKVEQFTQYSVFFTILAYTGMRPGEVAGLTTRDIDFDRGLCTLGNDTKTKKPRIVPLQEKLIPLLKYYIETFAVKEGGMLFPTARKSVWLEQFNMRIRYLGIHRTKLSTYSLRHSLITRLIEEDVSLFKIMRIVGHRRVETTAHYTHLTTKDIISAIGKDTLAQAIQTKQEKIIQGRQALENLGFFVSIAKESENGTIQYEVSVSNN